MIDRLRNPWALLGALVASALLGALLFALLQPWLPGASDRARIERVVHEYILSHPEIIPEAIDRLRAGETGLQRVVSVGAGLVEQHDRCRLALDQGVCGQLGVYQRATAQVDVEHQHVGGYTDLARARLAGDRRRSRPRGGRGGRRSISSRSGRLSRLRNSLVQRGQL